MILHNNHPYLTDKEKEKMITDIGLILKQLSKWIINYCYENKEETWLSRRDNWRWQKPAWTPMASPGLFPFLEISSSLDMSADCLVGDLPGTYWTLMIPIAIAEYFCIDDVNLKDLERELSLTYGISHTFADDGVAMAMQVPILDWSWSVMIAQVCLDDR